MSEVLLFILLFALVYCCMSVFYNRYSIGRRVTNRIYRQHRGGQEPISNGIAEFVRKIVNSFEEKFDWKNSKNFDEIKKLLHSAGYRESWHFDAFMFCKFGVSSVSVLLSIVVAIVSPNVFGGVVNGVAIGLAGGGVVYVFSENILKRQASKRHSEVVEALPDCLDLLVVCTEAGLALDGALKRVRDEMGFHSKVLSEELNLTVLELSFLPERKMALENFATRVPCDAVRSFVNTLIQAERFGTPLSGALKLIADEMRSQRIMRAEEKAARLPAVLTVPMIVFILPTLFIVLAGPAFIEVYDKMK